MRDRSNKKGYNYSASITHSEYALKSASSKTCQSTLRSSQSVIKFLEKNEKFQKKDNSQTKNENSQRNHYSSFRNFAVTKEIYIKNFTCRDYTFIKGKFVSLNMIQKKLQKHTCGNLIIVYSAIQLRIWGLHYIMSIVLILDIHLLHLIVA